MEWGPPARLVDGLGGDDPVVGIAAPRPDFEGALQEFLIGLLTAALAPADDRAWRDVRDAPPDVEALQSALDALPDAFDLDGDGPRFFQDRSEADFVGIGVGPVDQLLIDAPGEQTIKLNKDLFVKRARAQRLGRPAAAMALLTLQTYAPSGGQGHRTSLRGGGPLTTLVDPRVDAAGREDPGQPLWTKLWANVETRQQIEKRTHSSAPTDLARAFPWLHPARTSNPKEGGGPTSAARAHPLEAFFGVPRRIRLEFGDAGVCALTGAADERTVTGFRMRNYGAQYTDWRHPLTPHYRAKGTETWLPMHGQPGGVGWRHWVALTLPTPDSDDALRQPAATVVEYAKRSRADRIARLHVFGYDMDNMKARGWTEATMPLFPAADVELQRRLRVAAERLAEGTRSAADHLLRAVKTVLFGDRTETPGDIGHLRTELWVATEAHFYDTMKRLASPDGSTNPDDPDADVEAEVRARVAFAERLKAHALDVFDRWCPADLANIALLRRRVVARAGLQWTLEGRSKQGEKLFTELAIPLPEGGIVARAARKRSRTEEVT